MPANIIKSLEEEHKWEKAKALAAKEGKGDNYAYIMGIFKKMSPGRFSSVYACLAWKLASEEVEFQSQPLRMRRDYGIEASGKLYTDYKHCIFPNHSAHKKICDILSQYINDHLHSNVGYMSFLSDGVIYLDVSLIDINAIEHIFEGYGINVRIEDNPDYGKDVDTKKNEHLQESVGQGSGKHNIQANDGYRSLKKSLVQEYGMNPADADELIKGLKAEDTISFKKIDEVKKDLQARIDSIERFKKGEKILNKFAGSDQYPWDDGKAELRPGNFSGVQDANSEMEQLRSKYAAIVTSVYLHERLAYKDELFDAVPVIYNKVDDNHVTFKNRDGKEYVYELDEKQMHSVTGIARFSTGKAWAWLRRQGINPKNGDLGSETPPVFFKSWFGSKGENFVSFKNSKNPTEYVYQLDDKLMHSVSGMANYSPGKAWGWLRKQGVQPVKK